MIERIPSGPCEDLPLYSSRAGVGEEDFGINQFDYLAAMLKEAYPDKAQAVIYFESMVIDGALTVAQAGSILRGLEQRAEQQISTRT